MKKLLILFLVCFSLNASVDTYASNDTSNSNTKKVDLEILSKDTNTGGNRQRAPRYIDLEVFYSGSINSITINYNGDIEGEVYIYRNNILVGYDSQINTTILLPYYGGNYEIEIITDSWIAQGYLEL